jgi:ribosomal protein S24E
MSGGKGISSYRFKESSKGDEGKRCAVEDTACDDKNLKEDLGQTAEVEMQSVLTDNFHEQTGSEDAQIAEDYEEAENMQPAEPRYPQRVRESVKYHDGQLPIT